MTAVLDRVDSLRESAKFRRKTDWMDLVKAYVDGALPDAERVAAIFDETGKGRAELERDGRLLEEQRELRRQLAQVPRLQRAADEASRAFSASLREREAAEVALREAQNKCSQASGRASTASDEVNEAKRVAVLLRDPKFAAIDPDVSANPEADALRSEITRIEARLKELPQFIAQRESDYNAALQESSDLELADLLPKEKEAQQQALVLRANAIVSGKTRLTGEQHSLQKDLAEKRRELKRLNT